MAYHCNAPDRPGNLRKLRAGEHKLSDVQLAVALEPESITRVDAAKAQTVTALVTQPHAQDDIGTGELLSNARRFVDHENDELIGHVVRRCRTGAAACHGASDGWLGESAGRRHTPSHHTPSDATRHTTERRGCAPPLPATRRGGLVSSYHGTLTRM
eukprot:2681270-Prymnesium_polylepis.1